MKKKIFFLFNLLITSFFNPVFLFSQNKDKNENVVNSSTDAVEMADILRSDGKIYIVVITILLIFFGLFFYMWQTDKKISKVEKDLLD